MVESFEHTEFYRDSPMNTAGGRVNLQELSSAEIMELYEQDRRVIYLYERAQERKAVEAAEMMLKSLCEHQDKREKE